MKDYTNSPRSKILALGKSMLAPAMLLFAVSLSARNKEGSPAASSAAGEYAYLVTESQIGIKSKAMNRLEHGHSVTPDTVMAQRHLSISQLLAGEIAGVEAFTADGAPGAAAEVRIRGRGTIRGDLQPLYILDGVMLINPMLDNSNPWNSFDQTDYQVVTSPLAFINPVDVESITVLKNSSATALYGDRGANGVVLIRTRNGTKGASIATATANFGVNTLARRWDMLPLNGYREYMHAKGVATGEMQGVDWQEKLCQMGTSQNYNINLLGTARATDYALSLCLSSENGMVRNTGSDNIGVRINIDQKVSSDFRVGARAMVGYGTNSLTQSTAYLGASSAILALAVPPYRHHGETPMSIVGDYEDKSTGWHLVPQLYAQYKFFRYFSFNANAGIDNYTKVRRRWMGPSTMKGAYEGGRASRSTLTANNYNVDGSLDFEYNCATLHNVKVSALASYSGTNRTQLMTSGSRFFSALLQANGIGSAEVFPPHGYDKQRYNTFAFAGHASYIFDSRYILSGGLRADKIINIEEEFQPYPFINAGWNISQEKFWKSSFSDGSVCNRLEIFGGWGKSGKSYADPGNALSNITLGDPTLYMPFETLLYYTGVWRAVLNEYNAGINAEFLGGGIKASAEYYNGRSNDRLNVLSNDPARIYDIMWGDKMNLKRHGFELSLSGVVFKNKDWWVEASGNIAFNKMKVTDCGKSVYLGSTGAYGFKGGSVGILAGHADYATAFVNGYAPGVFYGYRTEGRMTQDNMSFAPSFKGQRLQVGDVKFIDVNEDGQVDENDKVVIGDPNAKFFGGFDLKGTWKRLSLRLRFDYSYGNDVLNLNLLTLDNVNGANNIRDKAFWALVADSPTPWRNIVGLDQITDRLVEDGSYCRLSNLLLSYNVPVKWKEGRRLDINFMASNLFTFTNYSGFSPVVNSFAGDWSLGSIDLGAYPRARFFSLGISAKF